MSVLKDYHYQTIKEATALMQNSSPEKEYSQHQMDVLRFADTVAVLSVYATQLEAVAKQLGGQMKALQEQVITSDKVRASIDELTQEVRKLNEYPADKIIKAPNVDEEKEGADKSVVVEQDIEKTQAKEKNDEKPKRKPRSKATTAAKLSNIKLTGTEDERAAVSTSSRSKSNKDNSSTKKSKKA